MSIPRDVISPQPEPPAKSSNTCLILGLVFGGFGGFVLLCGGCCVGFAYVSLGAIETQARPEIANNPVVVEHVGQIRSFKMDWTATFNEAQQQHENTFVFDVTGDKGSGRIVALLLPGGANPMALQSGQLTMSTGEVYELVEGADFEGSGMPDATGQLSDAQQADFERKVQEALKGNAVLDDKLGELTNVKYDVDASESEAEDVYVFDVTGSKGSGRLRAESTTLDADHESVSSAELTLENGEKVQLFLDKPLP
jgi:hypothetical protein